MPRKPVIAVDIDDVLAENAAGFTAFSNERWGTHLTPEDYQEDWSKMWQVDHEEAERRAVEFHESDRMRSYASDTGAATVLEELKKRFDVLIITSRRAQMKKDTEDWITQHYPGIFADGAVHFAGIWDEGISEARYARTKGELAHLLHADYLIDDQLKHCVAVAELGIEALLFGEYQWNRAPQLPEKVTRVKDWGEVKAFFDGRERL